MKLLPCPGFESSHIMSIATVVWRELSAPPPVYRGVGHVRLEGCKARPHVE